MKDEIFKTAMKWYEQQGENPDLEDFIEMIIDKTTDSVFQEVQSGFENEFSKGNLEHPFIISSEYYLELLLKDIRQRCEFTTKKNE